jgi:hypothetical protein
LTVLLCALLTRFFGYSQPPTGYYAAAEGSHLDVGYYVELQKRLPFGAGAQSTKFVLHWRTTLAPPGPGGTSKAFPTG